MSFKADFHIHSHYSRATSKEMNIISLAKWGQLKGLNVIGTGDFTHPKYFQEIQDTLEPAEEGLFKLKKEFEKDLAKEIPASCKNEMRFMLSVEISSIYKKNDKVRKTHNLIIAPKLEYAAKIISKLNKIGNLKSDGRPILGLDAKKLLEIVLNVSEECMLIPAHIWTPHFSVFGSMSGFDSLEECFEDLTPYIYALETGLSSDPAMNWRWSKINNLTLISNSDAHSARKLGREANVFNTDLSYDAITKALRNNDLKAFEATIEFFPEEGKYHLDGHRNCQIRLSPKESIKNNYLCPKCCKKVTIGVMHRVEKLADKPKNFKPNQARPFYSIIPLPEIIAEVFKSTVKSKKVEQMYQNMLEKLGNEFKILLDARIDDIQKASNSMIAEGINRMRLGQIQIKAGYDGEFGTVNIFSDEEKNSTLGKQATLF
ncbi:DNA helicase UvrD [Candidatus Peregrinibacteria bacterium RIFOXYA12_FULL_33_12]|nr:MAG: DNA helicase UvrD [Candidatus Peregrinibacteria bacterium RIFOXYA12_FULL_33_12]OGJ46210.1 MAG: DNA helicase UvrD [Candidatus Peregrinibacteria bacterium RIFOXYA2_FULL_33_21]OGJ51626.1 MAG: DNA helicase UvrD [Candidatus Peregrinibacteria bacterium RIFOXYB2_FULL_33_20]